MQNIIFALIFNLKITCFFFNKFIHVYSGFENCDSILKSKYGMLSTKLWPMSFFLVQISKGSSFILVLSHSNRSPSNDQSKVSRSSLLLFYPGHCQLEIIIVDIIKLGILIIVANKTRGHWKSIKNTVALGQLKLFNVVDICFVDGPLYYLGLILPPVVAEGVEPNNEAN